MEYLCKSELQNPLRVFRAAILNCEPVPETVRATLEARGHDTAELEQRLRQQIELRN